MNDVSYTFDCLKKHSDIQIVNNDIFLGDELITSFEFSMFSNSRTAISPETNVQDTINVLSGWWADTFEDEPLGSEAWIYDRSKITQDTLNGLSDAYTKSLEWAVSDGVVEFVTVTVVKSTRVQNAIEVTASFNKPQQQTETFKWQFAWEDIENAVQ